MSFFISDALAAPAAGEPSPIGSFIMLGGMLLIFYFFLWRPQSKRQKEHRQLVEQLDKGDEVVMTGGLLGKVIRIDEQYAVLEIANNTQVKVQKASVAATLPKGTLKAI